MERLEIPEFAEKRELYNFLVSNKNTLIAQKKNIFKEGDGFAYVSAGEVGKRLNAVKALKGDYDNNQQMPSNNGVEENTMVVEKEDDLPSAIEVKAVINTTNWLDSHYDVHIPGLWDKSLSENKMIMHVQEHKSSSFEKIIADGDQLEAFVESMTWRSLGVDMNGKTQALVFESTVLKERNKFMLKQYLRGWVKNHSVGMRYVNIVLCINDAGHGAEFEAWEKYYPMVINKERADELGFFWAVKEAKIIEGSAVPLGSNTITPTQSVESKSQPHTSTVIDGPSEDTRKHYDLFKNLNY